MKDRIPGKDEILSDLLSFSKEGKELTSRYFWMKYGEQGFSLDDFRRKFQERIAEIISTNKKYVVCANGSGFYIARTRDEALRGLTFIWSKLEDPLKRFHSQKEFINQMFPGTEEEIKKQRKQFQSGEQIGLGL